MPGRVGKDTFTKDAVTALKARVLLYKGDWEGAYTAATSLIGSYALSNNENTLRQAWATDATTESITQLYARYDQKEKAETSQRKFHLYGRREKLLWNCTLLPT